MKEQYSIIGEIKGGGNYMEWSCEKDEGRETKYDVVMVSFW